jgi:hypothetical protein
MEAVRHDVPFFNPIIEKGEVTSCLRSELMKEGAKLMVRRDGDFVAEVSYSKGNFFLKSKDADTNRVLQQGTDCNAERIGFCRVLLAGSSVKVFNTSSNFPLTVTLERNETTVMPESFLDTPTLEEPLPQIEDPEVGFRERIANLLGKFF